MLDIPCGLCTEFLGIQHDNLSIAYTGIDISPVFIQLAIKKNIPALVGSIEAIPLADSSYDLCYSRHILEHLPDYKIAVKELIRVARCEIIIIFSIPLTHTSDSIHHNNFFYLNNYNKKRLEEYICSFDCIKSIAWQKINISEIMLHIYLEK